MLLTKITKIVYLGVWKILAEIPFSTLYFCFVVILRAHSQQMRCQHKSQLSMGEGAGHVYKVDSHLAAGFSVTIPQQIWM